MIYRDSGIGELPMGIYMKLINAEQNKELLEKIPHRIFMDLAVVYYAVARDRKSVV